MSRAAPPGQVGGSGAIRLGSNASGQVYGSTAVADAMQRIVGSTRGTHVFEGDVAAVAARSIDAEQALRTAMRAASDPLFGTAPATGSYNAANDAKLRYDNPLTGAPVVMPFPCWRRRPWSGIAPGR